jgi:hypothetical protein
VKYTKENKHKHNIPDAKAFLWQICESCSVYVLNEGPSAVWVFVEVL